jgi:NAD(P)-dependent dehydrogenase (short-subunit alcohol dehydrogenase family)
MSESIARRFDLSGRVALVTGASRGIGRSLALGLAEAGADIAVHYATRDSEANTVAESVRGMGRRSDIFAGDLAEKESAARLVEQVISRFGRLDVLVLNASAEHRHRWDAMPSEDFDTEIDVNLRATLALIGAARPAMAAQRWGRVLLIGSIQSAKPNPMLTVYAALKAANVNLAKNLARQLAGDGITVNVLSPGAIATERNAGVLADPTYRARVEAQIPLGRVGEPDDCMGAALLLCSDGGRYITGVELFVDGGWHAA